MSDEKVKFDKWQQVDDAITKSQEQGEKQKLVIVCIAQSWNPPAVYVYKELEKLRKSTNLKILVVDADEDKSQARTWGVHATPSLMFFLAGKPLTIRRQSYSDDNKFVGAPTADNLAELLNYANSTEREGAKILYVEF